MSVFAVLVIERFARIVKVGVSVWIREIDKPEEMRFLLTINYQ